MSHHLVELRGASFRYPDGTAALQDLSVRIVHGESVALIGANGAGKSTLLGLINGLLLPSAGEVFVGDLPVTPRTLPQIHRTVGYVFQDADDQLFMPTVFDDVAFGPLNLGMDEAQARAQAERALHTVGAGHLAQRAPYRLSGGEKRAVAIAGVLAMAPSILVLDEPSSGLDAAARRRLIGLLGSFSHTRIIATHDLDLALDVCTRVLVLHEGRLVADGAPAQIFDDGAALARCGLEPPLSWRRRD